MGKKGKLVGRETDASPLLIPRLSWTGDIYIYLCFPHMMSSRAQRYVYHWLFNPYPANVENMVSS
jgi:hypothetical protein